MGSLGGGFEWFGDRQRWKVFAKLGSIIICVRTTTWQLHYLALTRSLFGLAWNYIQLPFDALVGRKKNINELIFLDSKKVTELTTCFCIRPSVHRSTFLLLV
jgi:hypothetical protein